MNNSREFQLIIKEGTAKLTITPTRITVKVPSTCELTNQYIQYAKLIAVQMPLDSLSLRGQFKEDYIKLYTDRKKSSITFYYQDLDKEIT